MKILKTFLNVLYLSFIQSHSKEVTFFALGAMVAFVFSFPFTIFFIITKSYVLLAIGLIVMITELLAAYYRRFFVPSSFILFTCISVALLFYSSILGRAANAYILYFAVFMFSFMVYGRKYLMVFFAYALIAMCCILTLEFTTFSLFQSTYIAPSFLFSIGSMAIITGLLILMIIIFLYYKMPFSSAHLDDNALMDQFGLTHREIDIIKQIAHGKTNNEIAVSLFIEESTVKTHLRQIFKKTKVTSRLRLISLCMDFTY